MIDIVGFTDWAWALGVLGLLGGVGVHAYVRTQPQGSPLLIELSERIHEGVMAFLRREYVALAIFVVAAAVLLGLAVGTLPTVAYLFGVLCSLAAGLFGMKAATRANARTTAAARDGARGRALRIAFWGGSVAGLALAALGLIGLGTLYLVFAADAVPGTQEFPRFVEIVAGFAMGASSVALFACFGGGIYAKATNVGVALTRTEAIVPEDDPRNPAVIADEVGHNVGDVGGMGADLFESHVAAVVATIAIGATAPAMAPDRAAAVALPLLTVMVGFLASLVGIALLRALERVAPAAALRSVTFVATGLFLAVSYLVVRALGLTFTSGSGRTYPGYGPWIAILAGTLVGVVIGFVSEYYTSAAPVRRIAHASQTGSATNIIAGLAVGMESTAVSMILVCVAIGASYFFAGLYGIAMTAVGMLATVGMAMSVNAYGPIADNARSIGAMARLEVEARQLTDGMDAAGATAAGVGKGFAVGSAALTGLALFSAYISVVGLQEAGLDIADARVVIGLFLGGVLPLFVSGLTLTAVGRAAGGIVEEVRRQFREVPGLVEGTEKPDCERCVGISTRAAFREMIVPASGVVSAPVAVGYFLGVEALGGLLLGAIVTGALLALFMANAGGAWDNAKTYLESGALGGKGSDPHKAAVVGDIVGDPFKGAAGPSLNVLVKLVGTVSLVLAPWLVRVHGIALFG